MRMIERVARAIYEKRNGAGCVPWSRRDGAHKAPYLSDARAAIEATREPTEDMISKVAGLGFEGGVVASHDRRRSFRGGARVMVRGAVDIGDDDLVTLAEAARLFFDGRLTKSSLRTEAAKGNLEIIRIANKDFVTRAGVRRMIEKCRVAKHQPAYGSEKTPEPGSSRMEVSVSAQDALAIKLKKLKENSPTISEKNSSRSAVVLPLK